MGLRGIGSTKRAALKKTLKEDCPFWLSKSAPQTQTPASQEPFQTGSDTLSPPTPPNAGKPPKCPYCESTNTVPKGYRQNLTKSVRIIRCRSCKRRFTDQPDGRAFVDHSSLIKITPEIMKFIQIEYPKIQSWRKLADLVEDTFKISITHTALLNQYNIHAQIQKIKGDSSEKPIICEHCGSTAFIKSGGRLLKDGTRNQTYRCSKCRRKTTFTENQRIKNTPKVQEWVRKQYPKIKSWRKLRDQVQKEFGIKVSYQTLMRGYKQPAK